MTKWVKTQEQFQKKIYVVKNLKKKKSDVNNGRTDHFCK